MKIPLLYIPRTTFKKFLYIEPRYVSDKNIIPLGCDCHPAYILKKLHLRKSGYPFDWLDTLPAKGLDYVNDTIASGFNYYLDGLKLNEAGNIIAEKYPYAVMLHETNLESGSKDRVKLERRAMRFLTDFAKGNNYYLYTLPVAGIQTREEAELFIESARTFINSADTKSTLHIILRYDENLNENPIISEILVNGIKNLNHVYFAKYIRNFTKYGLWGNPAEYTNLFKQLTIPVKRAFIKISVR